MAGKKQAKKAGAKKKAAAKKAPARKAAAKKPSRPPAAEKPGAKKKAGAKKAGAKKAGVKGSPPARGAKKGEQVEMVATEASWESEAAAADHLGKSWEKKWAKVVAKTWTDPAFKQQLLESPGRTLSAEGLPLLRDVEVRIVAGEGKFIMEIPLPDRPGDLDGEVLEDLLQDFHTKPGQGPKRCVMSSCCC